MRKVMQLLGLLAVTGYAATLVPGSGASPAAAVAAPIMMVDLCDIHCYSYDCDPGYHYAFEVPDMDPNAMRNGGVHVNGQCESGTCDEKHGPLCDGSGPTLATADLEELRTAIADNDAEGVQAFIWKYPSRVSLNVERKAVQVATCTGNVIAHLPLTAMVQAALAE